MHIKRRRLAIFATVPLTTYCIASTYRFFSMHTSMKFYGKDTELCRKWSLCCMVPGSANCQALRTSFWELWILDGFTELCATLMSLWCSLKCWLEIAWSPHCLVAWINMSCLCYSIQLTMFGHCHSSSHCGLYFHEYVVFLYSASYWSTSKYWL